MWAIYYNWDGEKYWYTGIDKDGKPQKAKEQEKAFLFETKEQAMQEHERIWRITDSSWSYYHFKKIEKQG